MRAGSRDRCDDCCCNVKMSSPNCSVKRSSLNGDLHVEPEGTASAGAVEGAVWRAADECPGGRRPPDHCAAGPAAEAPVRGRGPRRARARQPRPPLAPAVARGGAGRGRAADDDRLRGLQRHAPDREAAGASRPGHLARDGAAVPRAAWPPSEARAPGAARPAPAGAERRAGALIQIDGSPFPWLEDRGPELMLLGAIDDATSEILALQFRPAEDVHGYVTLFRDVFTAHGLPMAVYGDRLNLLVRNDAHWSVEEQLAGTQAPTHVGRILQNLAIGYIAARSPQAKGRIERLWNTLQDRLVSELRLRGIRTVEAAQAYLAEFITDFNQRFGKPPADRQAVWRRPPRDLALRLGCGYRRVVARDNTVRLGPRVVQLRGARSYAKLTVDVRELLDGRVVVLHDEVIRGEAPSPGPTFILKPRRAPSGDRRPRRVGRARPLPQRLPRLAPNTHTGRRPLATHPWRRAQAAAIRLHEARTGRTFSRRSDGGPNH